MRSGFRAGDSVQFAAALGAGLNVYEDAFQALHRCHASNGLVRVFVARLAFFGTTDSRCLQFDANTPWNRVRSIRGRRTNAARRAMGSSGSRTTWVEPSRNG